MGVPLARLFLTSLKPVITILGLCSVGVIMARKGVLADEKRKALNQLVFMVFVPSLICDRLASSLSVQGLLHLWPIVVNVLVSCANGALLGCLQVLLVRPPRFFVRHIIAMTALGNLGNLPLVIVPVVAQSEDLFKMDSEEGARLGQTYVVMGMLMAIVMQWTVAYNLLKKPADLDDQAASPALPVTAESPTSSSSEPKLEASFVEMVRDSLDFRRSVAGAASSPLPWRRAEECEATSPAGDDSPGELSLPTLPRNATTARPWGSEDSDSGASTSRSSDAEGLRHGLAADGKLFGADDATQPLLVGPHQPADRSGAGSSWRLTIRRVDPPDRVECSVRRVVGAVRRAINPPLAACMMGAVIGMVPDLKHLFYAGSDGAAPPLGLITDLVKRLAGAMIPCIMLVLGASLHRGPGPAMRNIPVRIAVSVVICRLVLVPLLGTALILSLVRCGLLPIPNRMFLFVLLVQHATPPALNLNTVATLNGNADQELSAVLFWCYIACSCILPLIMTLQLLVVQHVA